MEGELVPIQQRPANLPSLDLADPGMVFTTSLDTSSKAGKQDLMRALQDPTIPIADAINQVHYIRDFFAHIVNKQDQESGELITLRQFVLFTSKDDTIAITSEVAWKDLCVIANLEGKPPWSPARPILLKQVQKDATKRMFRLILQQPANKSK